MAVSSYGMPVSELIEALQDVEGGADLPVKFSVGSGVAVHSVRKHVVTNEEEEVVDAYVVVNG